MDTRTDSTEGDLRSDGHGKITTRIGKFLGHVSDGVRSADGECSMVISVCVFMIESMWLSMTLTGQERSPSTPPCLIIPILPNKCSTRMLPRRRSKHNNRHQPTHHNHKQSQTL